MNPATPTMALLDLIFLGCGSVLLAMIHFFHDHQDEVPLPEVPEEAEDYHPHTGLYLGIFGVLCALTAAELLVPQMFASLFVLLVVSLVVLAFAKAGLVGLFFMHLKDEEWQVYLALTLAILGILFMIGPICWDIGVVYGVYV